MMCSTVRVATIPLSGGKDTLMGGGLNDTLNRQRGRLT